MTSELRAVLDEEPRLARSLALQLLAHFKAGRATAIKELMERLEGKVPITITSPESDPESQTEFVIRVVDGPIEPTAPPLLPEPK